MVTAVTSGFYTQKRSPPPQHAERQITVPCTNIRRRCSSKTLNTVAAFIPFVAQRPTAEAIGQ